MRPEDYIPELDYPARNYEPFRGRQNHFCDDCLSYYARLNSQGLTEKKFPMRYRNDDGKPVISCVYDLALKKDKITRDQFDTEDEYQLALQVVDPTTWSWTELGWQARWYQSEILNCSNRYKAIRAGRRCGKTEALAILILWSIFTHRNFKVLVVCPYIAQVQLIFERLRYHISLSPNMSNSVKRDVHGSPQVIEINNGSVVKGFAAGGSSGGKSNQIRGQDAHLIVLDEADYIDDGDIEIIMAILGSNEHTKIAASSTPTGLRSRLYNWTHDKDEPWKEFWYISAESDQWKDQVERMFRNLYSPGGFMREFLAEFGEEMEGVFRTKDLKECTYQYSYEGLQPDHVNCTYSIGVDWNKTTGTHMVVVERPKNAQFIKYKVVDKVVIRKSEFTQHDGVKALIELDLKWKPAFVYCDAGYGTVQMEMIYKEGQLHPSRRYKERFKAIEMGGKTIIINPATNLEEKKDTKPLLVNMCAQQVEQKRCMFPTCEDTTAQIVPEEIPYANIGILQQARGFKVTKISPQGRPSYSQDYEHTLTAWMLAVFAHLMEFADYRKANYDSKVFTTPPLGMGEAMHGQAIQTHDEFGEPLPPSMIQEKLDAAKRRWTADQEKRLEEHKKIRNNRASVFHNGAVVTLQRDETGKKGILMSKTLSKKDMMDTGRFKPRFTDPSLRDFRRRGR